MIQRLFQGVIRIFAVDRPSPPTADSIKLSDQCYCGASLSLQIPMYTHIDPTGHAALVTALRETWHREHFHQMNKESGDLIDAGDNKRTENEDVRDTKLGFHTPVSSDSSSN